MTSEWHKITRPPELYESSDAYPQTLPTLEQGTAHGFLEKETWRKDK
ncbi:hypothetical protein [Pseudomonas sp. NA-150]